MPVLSQRDAAALLDVVGELERLDEPLAFPPHFLARLGTLLGSTEAGYSVLDRRNERAVLYVGAAAGFEVVVHGESEGEDPYWRLRHTHPCCGYRERTGVYVTPHTVSDFATQRQFRATPIWNELYRGEGINYWLDTGLSRRHGHTRVFIFTHDRHDFGEREKLLLELLAKHLERRAEAVDAIAEAVDALAAVEEAGDAASDVMLVGASGTIEFASPRSRALLARYCGVKNGTLPRALRDVLAADGVAVARADDGRLTIRAARVGGLLVLLLGEDDDRMERLTPRQRDVVAGVAAGLTDVQIAERLGIAPATVGKHLEAIYERLDVHTRTAAAAVYHG